MTRDEPRAMLEVPDVRRRAAFVEMAAEFSARGDTRHDRDAADFADYLARSADSAIGRGLKIGRVPSSTYWLVRDDRIVGCSRLRHRLTPELEIEGGHIGYDVRPTERERGVGTTLLRLTLDRAAAMSLTAVRITCDADNLGSIRVIEKNRGRLVGQIVSPSSGKLVRQYEVVLSGSREDRFSTL